MNTGRKSAPRQNTRQHPLSGKADQDTNTRSRTCQRVLWPGSSLTIPVSISPTPCRRIGKVELVLDCDKMLGRGRSLDGSDLGESPGSHIHNVRPVDHLDGHGAVLPVEVAPVVVEELLAQRHAAGARRSYGVLQRATVFRWEDVVVVIHLGHLGAWNVDPHLRPVARRQLK